MVKRFQVVLFSACCLLFSVFSFAQFPPMQMQPAYVGNGSSMIDASTYSSVPAAYAALPSCVAGGNTYAHCGTLLLPPATYPTLTSTWSITGPVHVVGSQEENTVLPCNVSGPCILINMSPFSTVHGPQLEDFQIKNVGTSSSAIGIEGGGVIEPVFRNLHIVGFTYAGQGDMLWNNPASGTFSERVILDHVHLDLAAAFNLKFTDTLATTSTNDFMYWRVENVEMNVMGGANGLDLENDAYVVGGYWNGLVNTNLTAAVATNVFYINGTAQFGSNVGATLFNDLFFSIDPSGASYPVIVWNVASGALVAATGMVSIAGNYAGIFSNAISGTFLTVLPSLFSANSAQQSSYALLPGSNVSGGNAYIYVVTNPTAARTLTISDPGANAAVPFNLSYGTVSMPTTAIAAGACGSTVTVAAAPVSTSNRIEWAYAAAPGVTDGLLHINAWVTSGNVNFNQCNPTTGSLTPTAISVNWEVVQ